MSKMKDAMAGIEESTQKIDDILKVIEGVVAESGQLLLGPQDIAQLTESLGEPVAAASGDSTAARRDDSGPEPSLAQVTSTLNAIVDDVGRVSDLVEGVARNRRRAELTHH